MEGRSWNHFGDFWKLNEEVMASRYQEFYDDFEGSKSQDSNQCFNLLQYGSVSNQQQAHLQYLELQKQEIRINRLMAEVPTIYLVTCIKSQNIEGRRRWVDEFDEKEKQLEENKRKSRRKMLSKNLEVKCRKDQQRLGNLQQKHQLIFISYLKQEDLYRFKEKERIWKTQFISIQKSFLHSQNKQNNKQMKRMDKSCLHYKKVIRGMNCCSNIGQNKKKTNCRNQLTQGNIRFIIQVLNQQINNQEEFEDQIPQSRWRTYQCKGKLEKSVRKNHDKQTNHKCRSMSQVQMREKKQKVHCRDQDLRQQRLIQYSRWKEKYMPREIQVQINGEQSVRKRKRKRQFYIEDKNSMGELQQEKIKTKYRYNLKGINNINRQEDYC